MWFLAFGIVGVFLLLMLLIPFVASGTRDARRAEGEALMNEAGEACREHFKQTGRRPHRVSLLADHPRFEGKYYLVNDSLSNITNEAATLTCRPRDENSRDGVGSLTFQWAEQRGEITWD